MASRQTANRGPPWWVLALAAAGGLFFLGSQRQAAEQAKKDPVTQFFDAINPFKAGADALAAPLEGVKALAEVPAQAAEGLNAVLVRSDVGPATSFAVGHPTLALEILTQSLTGGFVRDPSTGVSISKTQPIAFAAGFSPNVGGAGGFTPSPQFAAKLLAPVQAAKAAAPAASAAPSSPSMPSAVSFSRLAQPTFSSARAVSIAPNFSSRSAGGSISVSSSGSRR